MTQQLDALATANRNRAVHAQAKRELYAAGSRYQAARLLARMLEDPPEGLETVRVAPLLAAVPRVGRYWLPRVMRAAGISDTARLGALTARQRRALVRIIAAERLPYSVEGMRRAV